MYRAVGCIETEGAAEVVGTPVGIKDSDGFTDGSLVGLLVGEKVNCGGTGTVAAGRT